MGGVVFVLVRRLRRVVADELVTLMSCCPSILEIGFCVLSVSEGSEAVVNEVGVGMRGVRTGGEG